MIRKIVSILAGYAVFVVTTLLLFKVSGVKPHDDPTTGFAILATVYGIVFSGIAGLVTRLTAREQGLNMNYLLAFILAGFATFSLFKSEGNHWTQLLAIFIFAPASLLGGLFYKKRHKNEN